MRIIIAGLFTWIALSMVLGIMTAVAKAKAKANLVGALKYYACVPPEVTFI